jgi:hypothetical protein
MAIIFLPIETLVVLSLSQTVEDDKDEATVSEGDIKKLIRNAKERDVPIGVIAIKDETQFRQVGRDYR